LRGVSGGELGVERVVEMERKRPYVHGCAETRTKPRRSVLEHDCRCRRLRACERERKGGADDRRGGKAEDGPGGDTGGRRG